MELKQRIHKFWEYFLSIQSQVEHVLHHEDHEGLQQFVVECNMHLDNINHCEIEFEITDGFYEMTFASHGNKSSLYVSELLKKDAPEALLDQWIINAYRPPLSEKAFHSIFEVNGTSYQGSDFKIHYEIDEINKMITVQVYCKGLVGLDSDQQMRITRTMMELFIGELELEARISIIEILDAEIESEDVCLLPNFYEDICDIIVDKEWVEYHNPTQIYMAYKIDEKLSFEGLRKDMKLVVTTYPLLQEELFNQEYTICKSMHECGGEFGFLYFEAKGENEKIALLRQQLEKEIQDLLYPLSIARTIGGAIGTNYVYVDLLIFDKPAFAIAFEKMRKHIPFDLYYKAFLVK